MDEGRFRALEMHIPADTRYLAVVRRGVRNLAESMGFAREEVADLELAVSEAVTNSVEHGAAPDGEPAVMVKCQGYDDLLVVEVEDEGRVGSIPQRLEPSVAEERGRGVLMMRAVMDECEDRVTNQGIKVRMTKQKAHVGPI